MEDWTKSARAFWTAFAPPTFWLIAFFIIPLSLVWLYSFSDKTGVTDITLDWNVQQYLRALEPLYLGIFWKSILMAAATTFVCLVVSFPVAIAIVFAKPSVRMWLLLLVVLPFWTNLLIRTYALIAVLRTNGFINSGLEWIVVNCDWLLSFIGLGNNMIIGPFEPLQLLYNNVAVVFGLVYVSLPFMVLPLYAALDRLDRSYLEASLDLGASHLRTFTSIVVPLALPGIASGIIITFIPALGSYLTPDLLGGTDSQMIANVIASQFKQANNWPFGAALSFLLMYATFFALAIRAMLMRSEGRGDAK